MKMIRTDYKHLKIKESDLTNCSVWVRCDQEQFDNFRLGIKILENKYNNEKVILKDDFDVKVF